MATTKESFPPNQLYFPAADLPDSSEKMSIGADMCSAYKEHGYDCRLIRCDEGFVIEFDSEYEKSEAEELFEEAIQELIEEGHFSGNPLDDEDEDEDFDIDLDWDEDEDEDEDWDDDEDEEEDDEEDEDAWEELFEIIKEELDGQVILDEQELMKFMGDRGYPMNEEEAQKFVGMLSIDSLDFNLEMK